MAVAVALIGQEVKANDYATMCGNAISRQIHALWRLRASDGTKRGAFTTWGYVIELTVWRAPPRACTALLIT
jgi:hypothetical protein